MYEDSNSFYNRDRIKIHRFGIFDVHDTRDRAGPD
jgi:hypothetical protein